MWLIQYNRWWLASSEVLRGFGIISSQVFGHLRSFKGWIQTEACVIPSYLGMLMWNRETHFNEMMLVPFQTVSLFSFQHFRQVLLLLFYLNV